MESGVALIDFETVDSMVQVHGKLDEVPLRSQTASF